MTSGSTASDGAQVDGARLFAYGTDLFNAGYWWEAHEVWERLWRLEPPRSAEWELLKGLIMLAAAHLKWWSGQEQGRVRLSASALGHLRAAEAMAPDAAPHGLALPVVIDAFGRWCNQGRAPASREALLAGMPRLLLHGPRAGAR